MCSHLGQRERLHWSLQSIILGGMKKLSGFPPFILFTISAWCLRKFGTYSRKTEKHNVRLINRIQSWPV
jgi:hypothetical protein